MTHQQIEYEEIIRAAGYRVTKQRTLILDAVCEAEGHTPLGSVYARVKHYDKSIDKSTVYRTLALFEELGLVVSADTGDGETYYEIAHQQPHHHLVCRSCGNQQEVGHAAFQSLFAAIESEHNFHPETDHIVLFGLCADCFRSQG